MAAPDPYAMNPVAALTPLKILVVAEKEATLTEMPGRHFVRAIQRAFQGGRAWSPDGSEMYYAVGEELGVEVQTIFWLESKKGENDEQVDPESAAARNPRLEVGKLLKSCGHLFVVAILEDAPDGSGKFGQWLNEVATLALDGKHDGRIGLLPIAMDTQSENVRLAKVDEFQRMPISDLGEHALRAANLGLLVLQRAWSLLSDDPDGRMKLFISHAKKDGAAIALAIKSQIEELKWLQRFYDACDILPGTPWRRVLRNGVRESVVVILRTDIYEQRPWCVQEVHWAEEFGCPTVVVDLRAASVMPREGLPVHGMVTVTISDGNLIRVLNSALREAMRVRLFDRAVELLHKTGEIKKQNVIRVPRASLSTLGMVFENVLERENAGRDTPLEQLDNIQWVVTPEPFRESLRLAAGRLTASYFPNARLGIPRDILIDVIRRGATVASTEGRRPLHGLVIGISISNSADLAEWGYTTADVNRATVRLSEALLAAGARLVFGHDWRPDGIMDAICRLAIQYQTTGAVDPGEPLIQSLLPWPATSQMEPSLQTQLEQRGVLRIESLNGPPEISRQIPDKRAPRAIALVEMRKELALRCDARICLGGKDGRGAKVDGFYAGVIEEACRSERTGQPIYVGSFLGGVCSRVASAMTSVLDTDGSQPDPAIFDMFQVVPDMQELLETVRDQIGLSKETPAADSVTVEDLPDSLQTKSDGETLQERSGLDPESWRQLLEAPDTESFVTLVIRGLRAKAEQLRANYLAKLEQAAHAADGTHASTQPNQPSATPPRQRKKAAARSPAPRKTKRTRKRRPPSS